jgi:hypothetical protein
MSVQATVPSTPAAAPATGAAAAGDPATATAAAAQQQTPTGNPAAPAAADFRSTIPETYREKNYLRDVKSADDVFKMLDNAQTAIGKKGLSMPVEGAPQEEFDKFYNSLGRPETPDKYEFKRAEGTQVDEAIDLRVKEIMHKHGIPAKAATGLVEEYEAIIEQRQVEFDKEFDTIVDTHFGTKDVADKALADSQVMLGKILPPTIIPLLASMDPKAAAVMAVLTSEIAKKYGGEDGIRFVGGGGEGTLNDRDSIIAAGRKLQDHPAYYDQFHPEHASIRKQASETFAKLNSLKQGS